MKFVCMIGLPRGNAVSGVQKPMADPNTTMKLGSIGAYLLRYARAHYVTERPMQKEKCHD